MLSRATFRFDEKRPVVRVAVFPETEAEEEMLFSALRAPFDAVRKSLCLRQDVTVEGKDVRMHHDKVESLVVEVGLGSVYEERAAASKRKLVEETAKLRAKAERKKAREAARAKKAKKE